MSDAALDSRLDAIERRQRYVLALLVYPYLFGATWLSTGGDLGVLLTSLLPVFGLVVTAYLVALVRSRSSG